MASVVEDMAEMLRALQRRPDSAFLLANIQPLLARYEQATPAPDLTAEVERLRRMLRRFIETVQMVDPGVYGDTIDEAEKVLALTEKS